MVQLFQRYVPYAAIVDFFVQSLLCLTAFTVVVQAAWWTHLDPTLPTLLGVRAGRAMTSVAILVLVFYLTGYYDRRNHLNTSMFVPRLLQAVPLAGFTLALLYEFVPAVALSWPVAGSGLVLMSVLMIGWHAVAPAMVGEERLSERILLIGDGPLAAAIADKVRKVAPWGFRIAGFIPVADTGGAHSGALPGPSSVTIEAPSLGRLADLERIAAEHDVHTIVVAIADRRGRLPLGQLMNAKLHGIAVYDAVDFYERLTGRMMVARMRPSSIIFADGFAPSRFTRSLKRFTDVVLAGLLVLATAPLQLLIALAIRATSRGPALFRQERVGLGGVAFTMLKYRSMVQDAEKDGPQWAAQGDDRITSVGRLLRKTRLDELPQLWNVLAGQMSFVGPRPERPVFVRRLREQIPYYDQRHTVRPGITGWAQVKYPYGASVEETLEKLEYDLYYIKRLSVAFDVTIVLETLRVLLTGKGAR